MKIRNGFVSNSSSSSFVICGVSLGEGAYDEEVIEKLEELEIEYIADDYTLIVGDILVYCSNDDFGFQEIKSFDLPDKKDIFEKIVQVLPNVKKEDVKIYAGSIMS